MVTRAVRRSFCCSDGLPVYFFRTKGLLDLVSNKKMGSATATKTHSTFMNWFLHAHTQYYYTITDATGTGVRQGTAELAPVAHEGKPIGASQQASTGFT